MTFSLFEMTENVKPKSLIIFDSKKNFGNKSDKVMGSDIYQNHDFCLLLKASSQCISEPPDAPGQVSVPISGCLNQAEETSMI